MAYPKKIFCYLSFNTLKKTASLIHSRMVLLVLIGIKNLLQDLTLRKREPTSIASVRGFNKPQVYRFFDLLEEQTQRHVLDATRLHSMENRDSNVVQVLRKVGNCQVGLIARSERDRRSTVTIFYDLCTQKNELVDTS